MNRTIEVHMLPELVSPETLCDQTVVVIDVLRATTTITYALAAGAKTVVPCADVDQARKLADELNEDSALLGGERGGVKIEGFDLGNSPSEYARETVAGRTVVFTTTNGTRAMAHCRDAKTVLIGAFANLAAICDHLRGVERVHLLCSGTERHVTREDVLLAGAIAARLIDGDGSGQKQTWRLSDQARLAEQAWRLVESRLCDVSLAEQLRDSRGGRNVTALGLDADIETAAIIDAFDLVPVLDLNAWQINAANSE